MYIFKTEHELKPFLRAKNVNIGFVPTMGALHQGHISLIQVSKAENDLTVCSIFVNPTQFNDPKDFEKYPITTGNDVNLLEAAGNDVLFLPTVSEMYPGGKIVSNVYPLGDLDHILEGKHRPGHYNGVCTVVEKLLRQVEPHRLYLGEKDFQQCLVINKLINLLHLNIQTVICPTQREQDGLAMSSRNVRLAETDRSRAATIFQVLGYIKQNFNTTSFPELKKSGLSLLQEAGFETEYLELLEIDSLKILSDFIPNSKMAVLFAGKLGGVRLIDNIQIQS